MPQVATERVEQIAPLQQPPGHDVPSQTHRPLVAALAAGARRRRAARAGAVGRAVVGLGRVAGVAGAALGAAAAERGRVADVAAAAAARARRGVADARAAEAALAAGARRSAAAGARAGSSSSVSAFVAIAGDCTRWRRSRTCSAIADSRSSPSSSRWRSCSGCSCCRPRGCIRRSRTTGRRARRCRTRCRRCRACRRCRCSSRWRSWCRRRCRRRPRSAGPRGRRRQDRRSRCRRRRSRRWSLDRRPEAGSAALPQAPRSAWCRRRSRSTHWGRSWRCTRRHPRGDRSTSIRRPTRVAVVALLDAGAHDAVAADRRVAQRQRDVDQLAELHGDRLLIAARSTLSPPVRRRAGARSSPRGVRHQHRRRLLPAGERPWRVGERPGREMPFDPPIVPEICNDVRFSDGS